MVAMRGVAFVLCAVAVSPAASAQEEPGGIGYGRHALQPPRHDLRAPPLGADGRPIRLPEVDFGDVPPDRSAPTGPQSVATRHANWCRTRYRSYDGRTDTFVPGAGAPRVPCASPFRDR